MIVQKSPENCGIFYTLDGTLFQYASDVSGTSGLCKDLYVAHHHVWQSRLVEW